MKKILLFFFFIFGCFKITIAQSLFDKKYLQPLGSAQLLQMDNAGNIYIAGYDNYAKTVVIKLDSAGNVIWDKLIYSDTLRCLPTDMIITTDQRVVVAGRLTDGGNLLMGLIICLDTAGTLVYSKAVGRTNYGNYTLNNVISDSAGYTISLSCSNNPELGLKLIKFDNGGNIIYENMIDTSIVYPNVVFIGSMNVVKGPEGNYMLYLSNSPSGSGISLARTDHNFTNFQETISVYSADIYDLVINKMIITNDSEAYIFGYANTAFIGHVNRNSLICDWIKQFEIDSINYCTDGQNIVDAHQLPDKSWLLLGFSRDYCWPSKGDYFLMHTDSAFRPLNLKYIKSISSNWNDQLTKSSFSNNNFYFVAGHINPATSNLGINFDVIKTDTTLSGMCNEKNSPVHVSARQPGWLINYFFNTSYYPTLISNINLFVQDVNPQYGLCNDSTVSVSELNLHNAGLTISPNPLTSSSILQLNAQIKNADVVIYDMLGKEMVRRKIVGDRMEIEKGSLESGIYFVRVSSEEKQYVQKIIVE